MTCLLVFFVVLGNYPRQFASQLFCRHPHAVDSRKSRDLAGDASPGRAPDVFRRAHPFHRPIFSQRAHLRLAFCCLDSLARRLGIRLLVASFPDACRDALNLPSHRQTIGQFRRSLHRWFRLRGRDLPWRRTRDPYAILVSEFMLQQTQVATVISYYQRWLDRFPDFAALARAKESDVLHAWQGLGYYARARHLHAAGKFVDGKLWRRTSLPMPQESRNSRASAATLPARSPVLPSISPSRSSRPTSRASWHA